MTHTEDKITEQLLRKILKEETAAIREDVKIIKEMQGSQNSQLRTLQADIANLKNGFRNQQREMHRLGVLFEDLDNRFAAVAELP